MESLQAIKLKAEATYRLKEKIFANAGKLFTDLFLSKAAQTFPWQAQNDPRQSKLNLKPPTQETAMPDDINAAKAEN